MHSWGTGRVFFVGLAGGMLGALLLVTVPAVSAAVGDALRLGEVNSGNAVTVLRGSSDATLRLTNLQSGAPALDLRVEEGSPPLKVDSSKKVARLNADRVDGRSAHQLVRAAGARVSSPPNSDGDAATATITAPTSGYLVMSGSIEVHGSAFDEVQCALRVERAGTTRIYGHHDVTVDDAGGEHTSNYSNVCATDAVAAVPAGTYHVSLAMFWLSSAKLESATVWAVFVPFDGDGKRPLNPTW